MLDIVPRRMLGTQGQRNPEDRTIRLVVREVRCGENARGEMKMLNRPELPTTLSEGEKVWSLGGSKWYLTNTSNALTEDANSTHETVYTAANLLILWNTRDS
jgi:hypothetical protein